MDSDDPCYCPPDLAHFGVQTTFTFVASPHVTHGLLRTLSVRPRVLALPRIERLINFSFSRQTGGGAATLRRFFLFQMPVRCVTTLRANLFKLLGPLAVESSATFFARLGRDRKIWARLMRSRTRTRARLFQLRTFRSVAFFNAWSFFSQFVITHPLNAAFTARSRFRVRLHRTRGFSPEIYCRAWVRPIARRVKNLEAELTCETTFTTDPHRIPREIVLDAKFT